MFYASLNLKNKMRLCLFSFIAVILPMQIFAACDISKLQGKSLREVAKVQCPTFDPATGKGACKNSDAGVITDCILEGYDPPITLRPDNGRGITALKQKSMVLGCPPFSASSTADGKFHCASNNSAAKSVPKIGGLDILNNPNMKIDPFCIIDTIAGLSKPKVAPLPCGGALPVLKQYTRVPISYGGNNAQIANTITFGNVTIGSTDPSLDAESSIRTVKNYPAYYKNECKGSMVSLPYNVISLIVTPDEDFSFEDSNIVYKADCTKIPGRCGIDLPEGSAVMMDINKQGIMRLPRGGYIIRGDESINVVKAPDDENPDGNDGTIISYGNGTIVLTSQGLNWKGGNFNGFLDQMATKSGIPKYQLRQMYKSKDNTNSGLWGMLQYAVGMGVPGIEIDRDNSLFGCGCITNIYLSGKFIGFNLLKNQFITVYTSYIETLSTTNISIPIKQITAPANSYLSIPLGVPVVFSITSKGSISLPNGANITLPDGSSKHLVKSSILQSNGGSKILLPDGTELGYPNGVKHIIIDTDAVSIPAGTKIPIDVSKENGVVSTPVAPANDAKPKPSCF